MDVKKFCSLHLGKRAFFTKDGIPSSGMIVGYADTMTSVLVSFPTCEGWHLDVNARHCGFQVLVKSPLNVTFWAVSLEHIVLERNISSEDSLYRHLFTKITDGVSDWDVSDLTKLLSLAEKRGANKVLTKLKAFLEDF